MGSTTDIEWADRTWNPVTGCSKVSSGCKHCYAETIAERFRGGKAFPDGFDITLRPHKLTEPLRYRKHAKIFVNSMSDLFHEELSDEVRDKIFGTVLASYAFTNCHSHEYMVLTKRAGVLKDYFRHGEELLGSWAEAADVQCHDGDITFTEYIGHICPPWPLPNLWLGVSVELQKYLERIKILRRVPARVRFVSLEPLLNGIDVDQLAVALEGIDWVIIGGESGGGARPCMPEWIRNAVKAARMAGCAIFVKQMGTWWANSHGAADYAGCLLEEWPDDLRIREWPMRGVLK